MKYEPEQIYMDAVVSTAKRMCAAAQTAPKGHGLDSVVTYILTGDEKEQLACEMERLGTKYMGDEMPTWYGRDANGVRKAAAVVVIGAKHMRRGMSHCGMCGFENCGEMKKAGTNCVFNVTDLGIAIGSAVSIAADHRIDNRVMYSAGKGAILIGCLSKEVKICYGIPLGAESKSIYFDRDPGAVLL